MSPIIWVIIAIIVIVAIGAAIWYFTQQRRKEEARQQFGPEYERTVQQYGGDERKATSELEQRQQDLEKVTLHPLSAEQRDEYASEWQSVQAQFVDDPGGAVTRADDLIGDAMRTIGYPVDEFDQREKAISVKYPEVADNYRKAHEIAEQQANGEADTESLRAAMVLYRSLFERLVGMPTSSTATPPSANTQEA